jgi:ribonuclease R
MSLRERLLALLRQPNYQPANEAELARRLGLSKKLRSSLSAEVRLLTKRGDITRVQGDRLRLREGAGELEGKIQFRAGGSAFVMPDVKPGADPAASVQIAPDDTDVALPGDRVAVRIFPGVSGRRPGESVGRVVRVLERNRAEIVGELRQDRRGFLVVADHPQFVYEIGVGDPARAGLKPAPVPGDKVVVQLDEWRDRRQALTGRLSARLGKTHEPQAELLGIFRKYGLETSFPAAVEKEVASIPDKVQPKELTGRLDYRSIPVFTIDPDDAKDFDDALSLEPIAGGGYKVGIHIADVSTYVRTGTALDREAQKRGNSTYLVGTVIPMLPEKLSNGLCSLVEGKDRLCKAVFLSFNSAGKPVATDYANTVIRSRKRLTYKQAYALLFENDLDAVRALPVPPKHQTGSTGRALRDLSDGELIDLQSWIRLLWRLASRMRRERMARGSLDLDMPETKIFVDQHGYADRLERIEQDESHQLIEEFMLAANEAVARLTRSHKLPSLYRGHDDPDPEKLAEYQAVLATYGVDSGDLTRRENVVRLLETLQSHPQGYTLRTGFLRSMRKANYRPTSDGHYGLSKKDYTHFTSPIRRYSDLVVHRVLESYLSRPKSGPRKGGYDLTGIQSLAEHLSLTEINSAEAERESVKIKLLEFFEREMEKKKKTVFEAVITDVRRHGFFIELVESMTFGFIATEALGADSYQLNSDQTALVGRKSRRQFALNGRLNVSVFKVDRYKRTMDFRPVEREA